MKLNKGIFIVFAACLLITVQPQTAVGGSVDQHYSQIHNFNSELDSRQYTAIQDVIGRKITDETNRVIGKISDVRLSKGGVVSSLIAEFDGIAAGRGMYAISTRLLDMPARGAYSIPMHRNDVAGFVAAIEPAAGESASFPASSLLGAKVRGSSGQRFGAVQSVLLNSSGSKAFALMVRGGRGKVGDFVLPINNGVSSRNKLVFLDNDYSMALEQFMAE